MLDARDFEYGVVASRPDQMYGWPGLTRVSGEVILAAASERKYHVDPFGREVVMRSEDGGRTWSLPQEIYNSELDDRDASLLTMPDGTIVATWFTSVAFCQSRRLLEEWGSRADRVTQKMRDELVGGWMLRSFDGGRTWETAPHHTPVGQHAGPGVTKDGTLVYLGSIPAEDGYRMTAHASHDAGETWRQIGEIPCERTLRDDGALHPIINENHVLEVRPGRLLAMFRCHERGWLYQSISEDGGHTWSDARELPVWGYPPHLLRLESGAILCAYGHRRAPWSVRAVLSYDEGETWDEEHIITLYEWSESCDLGYPVSLEIRPGEILTIYYCSYRDQAHQRPDQRTALEGVGPEGILYTRFTLG